jgi:hypothetical protein
LIQKQIQLSRQAKPTLTSDDEWHKLIKDFENKKTEASNPPATGPLAPENQTPERRTTASPILNSASSPLPDPIDVQCSTPIPTRHPPAGKENPIDMHSTPTPIRQNNGGGKRWRERYTTPRQAKSKPPATSEKMSIQKSLDDSFIDRLSAMKISGTSKPAQRINIVPQHLFDGNGSFSSLSISSSTRSETTRSTFSSSISSQASSYSSSFPASSSTFVSTRNSTSSANLGATLLAECTIEPIDKESYDQIKRKRRPPDNKELAGPINHPTRGALYFLVTEGFYVQLHHRMPTLKHPDVVDVVYAIPKRKILFNKKSSTLKARKEKIGSAVEASLRAKRFGYNEESRRVMGGLIAFQPKVSSLAWEQILPFSLYAYFMSTGINVELEQLRLLCPKRNTMEALVKDFAADTMMICVHSLERAGTYFLSFDKADASKGKMGGCVKIVSWFDETLISHEYPDGQVLTLVLDADKTGGTSKDVADGVAYSMKKLCLSALVFGAGATTDSGGGGTIESVARALVTAGILVLLSLIANCTLHNLNLEMAVPLNKVLKGMHFESSKKANKVKHDDRDVEQLVYSAYAWEHAVSKDIVREYWDALMEHTKKLNSFSEDEENTLDEHVQYQEVQEFVITRDEPSGKLFIGMKRGCETRWWTLGEAADILYETLPMRISMAKNFDKLKQNGKARDTCRTFLSLAKEPSILCDLALLKCHHRFYMARTLQFFQRADPFTRKGGFGAFSVFVRCFLIREDYKTMNEFQSEPAFADLKKELENVPPEERSLQEKKIKRFFSVGLDEHEKMFERWVDIEQLGFLAAFGEALTARLVCQRILGYPFCANSSKTIYDVGRGEWIFPDETTRTDATGPDLFSFASEAQLGRRIDLQAFAEFVEKIIPVNGSLVDIPHIQGNLEVITKIARGFNIWDRSDPSTHQDRLRILTRYGALFSNNQGAERGNKDQNLAASNEREEANTSIRLAAMSCIKEMTSATIFGEKRAAFRGKKKIDEMSHRIQFVLERVKELKRESGELGYAEKHKQLKEAMSKTFTVERKKEAKESFEGVLSQQHIPSVKELISGIDISPMMRDLIQFGKIYDKIKGINTSNVGVLRTEWKGRQAEQLGRELSPEEFSAIAGTGIVELKQRIRGDEKIRTEKDGGYFNDKFFKPLHTSYDDYEWNTVK